MRRTLRRALTTAAVVGCTWGLGADVRQDAELQLQLGTLLFDESRYTEALEAFDRALAAGDPALVVRARKGKVRSALRVAEFRVAREEAERLRGGVSGDAEALTLHAEALWASGLFDEAERGFRDALAIAPEASRARFGLARSLATRNHLEEALAEALAASAAAPRDGDIHAGIGEILERLNRYDAAADAFTTYINLLPGKDRSAKATWSRAQVRFLRAFQGRRPLQVDQEDLDALHTVPFRLVHDKVVVKASVNGRAPQDFIIDTGSENTIVARDTARRARIEPITSTLSAGVGELGMRGVQLARLDSLDIGTLQVRNVPVLVKNPAARDLPRRNGESLSPLSFGMSMRIDYQNRLLTIGRRLPDTDADFRLPLRVHRLAMVRGLLNDTHAASFIVDTGGEVISISAEVARSLPPSPYRRIPLRVYGTSGWDRDAFLLPGVDLDFDAIEYRNVPLVVLNLRAPSILLGFEVGGIIGHKFLGGYRASLDMVRSELRLEKF